MIADIYTGLNKDFKCEILDNFTSNGGVVWILCTYFSEFIYDR